MARHDAPPDEQGGARRLSGERTGGLATLLMRDLVSAIASPLLLDRASATPRQRCSHAADASADFGWMQRYASSFARRFSSLGSSAPALRAVKKTLIASYHATIAPKSQLAALCPASRATQSSNLGVPPLVEHPRLPLCTAHPPAPSYLPSEKRQGE